MPVIHAKADQLNEICGQFPQQPLTQPVFLNSVPKCGTHLIRNIVRMFVPVAQQYHRAFIQYPVLHQHRAAFDGRAPMLSWGHLLFSDESAQAVHGVNHVLIVRDPYDWVLARARFFLSDNFQGSLEHLKNGKYSVDQLLNMMIFGIYDKAPELREIFTHNAVAWLGSSTKLIRYEDLVFHLKHIDRGAAEDYFAELLASCGVTQLPTDWKQRVLIGSDRKHSATARENLSGPQLQWPDELPALQKQMVDYVAPGLRAMLGYR
ncbi:hypothetical protein HPT27_04885 [Permianibacter sp. IMCC34836]|nr:hypothetical protein [Permianibacter fluminis]